MAAGTARLRHTGNGAVVTVSAARAVELAGPLWEPIPEEKPAKKATTPAKPRTARGKGK